MFSMPVNECLLTSSWTFTAVFLFETVSHSQVTASVQHLSVWWNGASVSVPVGFHYTQHSCCHSNSLYGTSLASLMNLCQSGSESLTIIRLTTACAKHTHTSSSTASREIDPHLRLKLTLPTAAETQRALQKHSWQNLTPTLSDTEINESNNDY